MKKRGEVFCYSNSKGKDLLQLCNGQVDGVSISSCHPYWYRSCKAQGRCRRFFSEGTVLRDRQLAKLLKKPVSRLTYNDKYKKAEKFEEQGFKSCKRIKVIVNY